jgi:hypothetical protein
MSEEVYSKIYLSILRSLGKKEGRLAVLQRSENSGVARGRNAAGCGGIVGGADSFTIIGNSGIGKTTAIARALELAAGDTVIELESPYCRIIPAIQIQTPFDCSVKGMLLEILGGIDAKLGTHYHDTAVKTRATTDMLIGSVSQTALNHVGLIIVDEIQNIINHRQGMGLVGCLTQLINNSGISICMVGVEKVKPFFESTDYLARRAMGLEYEFCGYDGYFMELCNTLFRYQYVARKSEINEGIRNWLYEHSGGVTAHVVMLVHDAQELSILNGREVLDLEALNLAWQKRSRMAGGHIHPSISLKKPASKEKNEERKSITEYKQMPRERMCEDGFSFIEAAKQAKSEGTDIMELLKGRISITEVVV